MLIKILFLDDRTKRITDAIKTYSQDNGYDLTIVTNVKECLRQMSRHDFDFISLDHDLNGADFEDPESPNHGMAVINYIMKTGWPPQRQKPTFWIHSSNIFAAHLMDTTLQEMGFTSCQKPYIYNETTEHMQYDKDGNPL